MAIEIRTANIDDAGVVASYHDRCFRDTYALQLLAGEIEVPVLDGTPIGHFTVLGNQLVHLLVKPEHQGKGLGRRLLALGDEHVLVKHQQAVG